jgi:hypothetical protein
MSWKEKTYQETLDNIVRYYESKVRTDTTGTLVLVNQELQSQWVRPGNDWTGRWGGVVIDTIITATISALEIVQTDCLEKIKTHTS